METGRGLTLIKRQRGFAVNMEEEILLQKKQKRIIYRFL